ncbi:MAG: N-acetylmuramoyl-L-alanine amidase [Campylobacterales bacterium]|nr:N-acetylmuramoyl-L-alanine amidase [Campylobacterales bacterium]
MNYWKVFLFFISLSNFVFASLNTLQSVKVQNGELQLFFAQPVAKKDVRQFTLDKPYRKVFDIKNTKLSSGDPKKSLSGYARNIVRISQYQKDSVRLVIESGKPFQCNAYQPMFSRSAYFIPLPKSSVSSRQESAKTKRRAVPKVVKSAPSEPKSGFLDSIFGGKPASKSSHHEVIVIDPGHGGIDSGALGGGKKEKDLVLMISKKLAKELKKRGHVVYLTRGTDIFLKLPQRTKIADSKHAKVFVSVHANSSPSRKYDNKFNGIETFFLQNTRDERSQRVAARENEAVLKGTDNLSKNVILDSVLSGPKIVESHKLAIDVQRKILNNVRSRFGGVKDGGVRSAPFWVLVGASRPSILVEVGYISHPVERKQLFTPRYQDLIAKGIAEGIDQYLANRKREIDL